MGGLSIEASTPPWYEAIPWTPLRRLALSAYAVVFVIAANDNGVPIDRDRVLLWVLGALLCASIGKAPKQIAWLVVDWLPFALVLIGYDYSRGWADSVGSSVHYTPQIDADKLLFWGHIPTEWLQEHLFTNRLVPNTVGGLAVRARGPVRWYEVVFDLTYLSHYLASFALAGVLWARDRKRFVTYARRFVTLSFAGFLTYVIFPAAPPWLAARDGYIDPLVGRVGGRGNPEIGLEFATKLIDRGQATVNFVAAIPSLHAGFATLIAITFWRSLPRPARPLLALYPLLMGLTLVATGEHYVVDIIIGVFYALGVNAGWNAVERRLVSRTTAVSPIDQRTAEESVTMTIAPPLESDS
ncbi:MAG: phosphatase PAP2 family protein [Acidimicrobiales bacterium]